MLNSFVWEIDELCTVVLAWYESVWRRRVEKLEQRGQMEQKEETRGDGTECLIVDIHRSESSCLFFEANFDGRRRFGKQLAGRIVVFVEAVSWKTAMCRLLMMTREKRLKTLKRNKTMGIYSGGEFSEFHLCSRLFESFVWH